MVEGVYICCVILMEDNICGVMGQIHILQIKRFFVFGQTIFDLGKESHVGGVRLDGDGDEEESVVDPDEIGGGPLCISSVLKDSCTQVWVQFERVIDVVFAFPFDVRRGLEGDGLMSVEYRIHG